MGNAVSEDVADESSSLVDEVWDDDFPNAANESIMSRMKSCLKLVLILCSYGLSFFSMIQFGFWLAEITPFSDPEFEVAYRSTYVLGGLLQIHIHWLLHLLEHVMVPAPAPTNQGPVLYCSGSGLFGAGFKYCIYIHLVYVLHLLDGVYCQN